MGEWQAYEKQFGPLLLHTRVDFGLAAIRTVLAGGGDIKDHLPYWYDTSDTEDEILGTLRSLITRTEEGEFK